MLRWLDPFFGHGRMATIVAVSALIGGISLAGILIVYVVDEIGGDDTSTSQGPTGGTGTSLPGSATTPGGAPPATSGSGAPPVSTPPTQTPPTQTTPPPSSSPFQGGGGIPGGVGSGGGGP